MFIKGLGDLLKVLKMALLDLYLQAHLGNILVGFEYRAVSHEKILKYCDMFL